MAGKLGHIQKLELIRRVVEAAAGHRVPTRELILALGTLGGKSIRITPDMVKHLREGLAQQDTINAAVQWTMRVHGVMAPYSAAYDLYVERIKSQGLDPVDIKTFKNKALQEYRAVPVQVSVERATGGPAAKIVPFYPRVPAEKAG